MALAIATEFDAELNRTEKDISELRNQLTIVTNDIEKGTRLAYRLYHRACLTGILSDFYAADTAADNVMKQFGSQEDLCLLKANIYFKFHRLSNTKRELKRVPALLTRCEGKVLQADIHFQEGNYEQARAGYELAVAENRTWDNLARLAYFKFKMGDIVAADDLYAQSEDELTAKEMRSYAWVELQRGLLHLSRGRYNVAFAHYKRAEAAYSGYWLTDEHVAELLGAQGKYSEAASLYEQIVVRVPKPELQQALGEIYTLMGDLHEAERWQTLAEQGYLHSVAEGGVHYWHHLVDFYSDVRQDGAEAVKWARKDLALRDNFATRAALAWALYRNGESVESAASIDRSLESGVIDARLFYTAGTIYRSAGRFEEGERLLHQANELNPNLDRFHVHR